MDCIKCLCDKVVYKGVVGGKFVHKLAKNQLCAIAKTWSEVMPIMHYLVERNSSETFFSND